jgi:hypothetical protein
MYIHSFFFCSSPFQEGNAIAKARSTFGARTGTQGFGIRHSDFVIHSGIRVSSFVIRISLAQQIKCPNPNAETMTKSESPNE